MSVVILNECMYMYARIAFKTVFLSLGWGRRWGHSSLRLRRSMRYNYSVLVRGSCLGGRFFFRCLFSFVVRRFYDLFVREFFRV